MRRLFADILALPLVSLAVCSALGALVLGGAAALVWRVLGAQ